MNGWQKNHLYRAREPIYSQLNRKYEAVCANMGVDLQICTVTAKGIPKWKIYDACGTVKLDVNANAPEYLGYEKYLAWGVREALLPRLVLETERLRMRRFTAEDKDGLFPILSDAEGRYMNCSRSFDSMDAEYDRCVESVIQSETQYAVVLKATGELIGSVNVFPDEARAVDAMEIGYVIAKTYQRKGYAYEILTALLNLLQDKLLVDTVSAGVLPENKASIGLLKKLGFQAEGLRHHGAWHEVLDKPVDLQYFYYDREISNRI